MSLTYMNREARIQNAKPSEIKFKFELSETKSNLESVINILLPKTKNPNSHNTSFIACNPANPRKHKHIVILKPLTIVKN